MGDRHRRLHGGRVEGGGGREEEAAAHGEAATEHGVRSGGGGRGIGLGRVRTEYSFIA